MAGMEELLKDVRGRIDSERCRVVMSAFGEASEQPIQYLFVDPPQPSSKLCVIKLVQRVFADAEIIMPEGTVNTVQVHYKSRDGLLKLYFIGRDEKIEDPSAYVSGEYTPVRQRK